jgi:kynurenine formamidase
MASSRRQFLLRAAAAGSVTLVRPRAEAQAQVSPSNAFDYKRNWGRWGKDDEKGAVNLITPAKRAAAASLVKSGRAVSLAHALTPPQHYFRTNERGTGHSFVDYIGLEYHGVTVTHVDALCHMWDRNGMWNGRDPAKETGTAGARFGDITAFGDGLITRGVLLDVPRHRRQTHVTADHPVTGDELGAIAKAQGVMVQAGDALLVHSGREAFARAGAVYGGATDARPGLHVSCARFVRDADVAVMGWDMLDARPDADGHPWPVHGVLYSYGVVLLDNALLEPLAEACAQERRYEFMFMALPLKVPRGTGSPVNPIALF